MVLYSILLKKILVSGCSSSWFFTQIFCIFLIKLKYNKELLGNRSTNKVQSSFIKNDLLSCQHVIVCMETQKQT